MKLTVDLKKYGWKELGVLWLLLILTLKILTLIQVPLAVTNVLLIGASFGLVAISYYKNQENKWEMLIFVAAFVAHLLVLFLDLYGRDYITILYSGKDTETFFGISQQYYYGDFSETITYYPHILNIFYKIIGLNRLGAQYINILAWCLGMILMEKCCKALDLKGGFRGAALLLMAFLPNYMCVTSVLLREGIIVTMNLLWLYCQIQWMKEGKHIYLIGCLAAPAVSLVLHMSAIVFWGLTVFCVALYDFKKKEFRIQKKTAIIVLAGVAGLLIFLLIPTTRRLITLKLPDFDEGFLNTMNEMVTFASANAGGSSYLNHVYVTGYGDFIVQTFVRIFYFLASPLPIHWRGLTDVVAFAISSAFYLVSILLSVGTVFIKKKDSVRTLIWGVFLMISGIFSWGVFNAATAMRHRDKIVGACILLLLYSLKTIREAWKNR